MSCEERVSSGCFLVKLSSVQCSHVDGGNLVVIVDLPSKMAEYVRPYIGAAKKNSKKFPTFAIVQALLR